ncbi:DUF418 domain-containing protein [Sphingomonas swuensis]
MTSSAATPVGTNERHNILDALRGWALLGVLTANMTTFIGFGYASDPERDAALASRFDDLAELLIEWLVVGKFYSLFSLLFGIGFALQLDRLQRRGEGAARFARRLLVLFLFGLAHLFLLWMGDILALYALMGFALLLFRQASDRALLRWAVFLWLVPIGWSAMIHHAGIDPAGPIYELAMREFAARGVDLSISPAAWLNDADYLEQLNANPAAVLLRIGDLTYQLRPAKVLAMFLLGLWIGRRSLFADPSAHRPLLLRVAKTGMGVGLPLALVRAILHMNAGDSHPLRFAEETLYCISTPLLALGYAAAFTLLWSRGRRAILSWPDPAGRMALTNYLAQSLVQSLVFTGMGFALATRFGLVFVLLFAPALFAAQVVLSRWWLARFRFGPCEWLWRSATYGRAQPMRLARPVVGTA